MRVHVRFTGLTGLVMQNIRLADPDDPYAREIAEINKKGSKHKTDHDRAEIARLEWFGGLYHDPEVGVYMPTWNIVRCLERGGVVTREGSAIIRAVVPLTDRIPVNFDGPTGLDELYAKPEFSWRTMVRVQQSRVPRTRPIFRRWSVESDWELLDDVMNLSNFTRIAQTAGRVEGLGTARKLGYGRFDVEVTA